MKLQAMPRNLSLKIVVLIVFSANFPTLYAQLADNIWDMKLYNTKLKDATSNGVAENKNIYFRASGLSYLVNNEYDNTIAEGATIFGIQQFLTAHYKLDPQFKISAGLAFKQTFGLDIGPLYPLLNLQFRTAKTYLSIGNLSGPMLRQNPYVLESFEFRFQNPVQYGIESYFKLNPYSLYAYMVVKQATIRNTNMQEEFYGGFSLSRNLSPKIVAKLQVQAHHFGGEGTKDKLNIRTYTHTIPSLKYINRYQNKRMDSLQIDLQYVGNYNILDNDPNNPGGWGMWGSVQLFKGKWGLATGAYYMSAMEIINGDHLMSGFTKKLRGGKNQFKRLLWFNRLTYTIRAQQNWSLGIQYLYALEVNNGFNTDHSARIWLKYDLIK